MKPSASVSFMLAVIFGVIAFLIFAGPALSEALSTGGRSVWQSVEQAIAAAIESVMPAKSGAQAKAAVKYKQDLSRAQDKLKKLDADRAKAQNELLELKRKNAQLDWFSMLIANLSNIMAGASAFVSAFFAWRTYSMHKQGKSPARANNIPARSSG